MPTPTFDDEVYEDSSRFKDDNRLYVKFFREAVQNIPRSAEEGRPIFVEVDMVSIRTPGSRDVLVTRASEEYQHRFPKQWDRYKRDQEQTVEGTPLKEVPWLTVGQIAELNGVFVTTLEQLAAMPDNLAQKFMGSHQLRQRAQAMIDAAKQGAPLSKMQEELKQRDLQIAGLQDQLNKLIERMKAQDDQPEPEPVRTQPSKGK